MSLDVIADVDAANGVAQAGTYDVKVRFEADCLARNGASFRITVLNEAPHVLFSKPILSFYLRVRFCKPLIPEVQSAAFVHPKLRAIHDARRNMFPPGSSFRSRAFSFATKSSALKPAMPKS